MRVLYTVKALKQKAKMVTTTPKRQKFGADYNGDFTLELVKTMEEKTDSKNRTDLMLKAFSALDEQLSGQSVGNVLAELTEDEKSLVNEALKAERINVNQLIKRGLLSLAKTYVSSAANKKQRGFEGLSYNQLAELGSNGNTIRGLAEAKIEKCFEAIQQFNRDQVDEVQRIYVSQNTIYQITNSNLDAIKKWLRENEVNIQEANFGCDPKRGTTRNRLRSLLAEYFDR